jgi:hypothetical protein
MSFGGEALVLNAPRQPVCQCSCVLRVSCSISRCCGPFDPGQEGKVLSMELETDGTATVLGLL